MVIRLLALTRRKGESIIISDSIEVVVLGIQGEQVKLGILAPKAISVHRKEVYEQIQAENKAAVANTHLKIDEITNYLK